MHLKIKKRSSPKFGNYQSKPRVKNPNKNNGVNNQQYITATLINTLIFSLPRTRSAGPNTDLSSNSNLSKTVREKIIATELFLKGI